MTSYNGAASGRVLCKESCDFLTTKTIQDSQDAFSLRESLNTRQSLLNVNSNLIFPEHAQAKLGLRRIFSRSSNISRIPLFDERILYLPQTVLTSTSGEVVAFVVVVLVLLFMLLLLGGRILERRRMTLQI